MAAMGLNKSLMDQRDLYFKIANKSKGARERLNRLRLTDYKLFGGSVGSLN